MHPPIRFKLAVALVALASSTAFGAEPPATSVTKECTTLKGAAKTECEKVGRQMDASVARPETAKSISNADTPAAMELHHSSPIMVTKEEKVVADAAAKGKDPKKELEKLEAQNLKAEQAEAKKAEQKK